MKSIETLLTAPITLSMIVGAQHVLRGREGGPDVVLNAAASPHAGTISPLVLIGLLGLALLSGAILVSLEMRAEARDLDA